MRRLQILAFAAVTTLAFAGSSQALPVSGAAPIATTTASIVDHGATATTEVRWHRGYGWRHRGWHRRHYWHRRHWR